MKLEIQAVPGASPRDNPPPDTPSRSVLIPTRSERQSFDWSLVLASQSIPCAIRTLPDRGGSALEVDVAHAGTALRTLRVYHLENRHWHDALQPASGTFPFQPSVLLWCFLMVIVHTAATASDNPLETLGRFETALVGAGQWWRSFTATFLHRGADHLAANLTSGLIVLGLAIGRFGIGTTLFLSLLAGAASNLVAWFLRPADYIGLGASGVVMGALGMLALSLLGDAREGRASAPTVVRGFLGGTALFILLGTSPHSDVLAHALGFVFGVLLAAALALLPRAWTRRRDFDAALAVGFAVSAIVPWLFALR